MVGVIDYKLMALSRLNSQKDIRDMQGKLHNRGYSSESSYQTDLGTH